MSSMTQIAQLEQRLQQVEKDLAAIKAFLKLHLSPEPLETPIELSAIQCSIEAHLVSDEDPLEVLLQMRRRGQHG